MLASGIVFPITPETDSGKMGLPLYWFKISVQKESSSNLEQIVSIDERICYYIVFFDGVLEMLGGRLSILQHAV